jgi:hypothetical protein
MNRSPEHWDPPFDDAAAMLEPRFDSAAAAAGLIEERYVIAQRDVALRFAGRQLHERLARAFAHLGRDCAGDPDLTVNLWDSTSAREAGPPLPRVDADGAPGAFYCYSDARVRVAYQPGSQAVSVFDEMARTAWYWTAEPCDIPYWDRAAPIRQILHWWLESLGGQQLHGGAVGDESGGLLVVGPPGSGKSTTTIASLNSGLLYAGDDYVGITLDPEPYVHSLYSSGKLEPGHLRRMADPLPALFAAEPVAPEKSLFFVHESFPHSMTAGFPLRAIVVPRVTPRRDTVISPASATVAFAALAPSTIVQLHTAGQSALTRIRELVERVPCYRLELGDDVSAIPAVIGDVLRSSSRGTAAVA